LIVSRIEENEIKWENVKYNKTKGFSIPFWMRTIKNNSVRKNKRDEKAFILIELPRLPFSFNLYRIEMEKWKSMEICFHYSVVFSNLVLTKLDLIDRTNKISFYFIRTGRLGSGFHQFKFPIREYFIGLYSLRKVVISYFQALIFLF
jgi:hypothetical protein